MTKNQQSMGGGGYPIAAEALDLELYLLACGFAASLPLSDVGKENPAIRHLVKTFELSEVSKRLIFVAVAVRSMLDQNGEAFATRLDAKIGSVGLLTPDATKPLDTKPLTLREACNKVIHASLLDFQFNNEGTDGDFSGLSPRVQLHGTLRNTEWQADIYIYNFIKGSHGV